MAAAGGHWVKGSFQKAGGGASAKEGGAAYGVMSGVPEELGPYLDPDEVEEFVVAGDERGLSAYVGDSLGDMEADLLEGYDDPDDATDDFVAISELANEWIEGVMRRGAR